MSNSNRLLSSTIIISRASLMDSTKPLSSLSLLLVHSLFPVSGSGFPLMWPRLERVISFSGFHYCVIVFVVFVEISTLPNLLAWALLSATAKKAWVHGYQPLKCLDLQLSWLVVTRDLQSGATIVLLVNLINCNRHPWVSLGYTGWILVVRAVNQVQMSPLVSGIDILYPLCMS